MDANAAERVGMKHLAAALDAGGAELLALIAREDLIARPELDDGATDILYEAAGFAGDLADALRTDGPDAICDGGCAGPHVRIDVERGSSPAAIRIVAAVARAAEAAFASAAGEEPRLDLAEAGESAAALARGLDAAAATAERLYR